MFPITFIRKQKNMDTASFLLEFQLNFCEIKRLNKMYVKHLFRDRLIFILVLSLVSLIFFDFSRIDLTTDLFSWLIRSLVLIVFFVIIEPSFVKTISKIFFQITERLMKFDKFHNNYKLTFTSSAISVKSPLGKLTHKWSKIEKVMLTKNFLFLYIKERNGYIISISKKDYDVRKMEALLNFVEKNVTHIIKV